MVEDGFCARASTSVLQMGTEQKEELRPSREEHSLAGQSDSLSNNGLNFGGRELQWRRLIELVVGPSQQRMVQGLADAKESSPYFHVDILGTSLFELQDF